jgi:hypothetical protein
VIEIDVKRSFTLDKSFDKSRLLWLLKVGTENLKDSANYCQGMNYIAGMFLYQGLPKHVSLELYVLLIHERMRRLFDDRLSYLNVYFFVLERLLTIFLPDLSNDLSVN